VGVAGQGASKSGQASVVARTIAKIRVVIRVAANCISGHLL
jgi:hypothetical protein